MRNLKRALSLALASVMVLGMMVVGAGAASFDDFTDKDKIVNVEAVSILNTLNVINGKDDNSFDPTGIVTRAEMAKMICVVLNGGKDPNLGSTATTSYTDTVGNWAAGYIEFCTNQKIVGGDGTGKFNPTNTVTGQEAAKMLLVAMGYDAGFETMTGASWATSVNVLANKNGLYDGLTIDPSVGLSRDDAAQMIYNALDAKMVEYDYAIIPSNGTLDSIATAKVYSDNRTILTDKFGAVKVEGVVVSNEVSELGKTDKAENAGKTVIDITNGDEISSKLIGDGKAVFSVSSGMAELGRSVSLYVKPYSASKGNTEKATVIGGVILNEGDKVVVDTGNDSLFDVADDNNLDLIYDDQTGETKVYTNYGAVSTIADEAAAKAMKNTRGVERTLIDNDGDGEVDVILMTTYAFGKVTKYATKDDGSITVKVDPTGSKVETWSKDKSADVVGFEDVSKDDYVLAAQIGGKLYVEKAESVTGNLDLYKKDASLTVDGTKYNVSKLGAYNDGDLTSVTPGTYDNTGNEATFYFDKFGNIVAVGDATESASNYAFVIGYAAGNKVDSDRAKVLLSDGTKGTYTVDKVQVWNTTDSKWETKTVSDSPKSGEINTTAMVGTLVAYSINSDDELLIRVATSDGDKLGRDLTYKTADDSKFVFEKGKTSVSLNSGTYYANSTTSFFYINEDQDGGDVYTGNKTAPSVDFDGKSTAQQTDFQVILDDGDVKAIVVINVKASAAGDYLYLYNYQGGNTDVSYFDAIIDGTLHDSKKGNQDTIVVNTSGMDKDDYGLYEYTINSDNEYDLDPVDFTKTAYKQGLVTKVSGNSVFLGSNEYLLTDKSVVAVIDGGDTALEETIEKGDYIVLVQDDGDIEAAFITHKTTDEDTSLIKVDGNVLKSVSGYDYQVDASTTGDAVKDAITVYPGATVKVTETDPTGDDDAMSLTEAKAAGHKSEALSTGDAFIIVINGDSCALYTLKVN